MSEPRLASALADRYRIVAVRSDGVPSSDVRRGAHGVSS